MAGDMPLPADHHHRPVPVNGYLPGHRSQLQSGDPATLAGADDYHLGRAAKLAKHVGGRPAGQQRPDARVRALRIGQKVRRMCSSAPAAQCGLRSMVTAAGGRPGWA